MSDVQGLFVVLAVLYAWECACWLRRGSVAFFTWLGGTWRMLHPGTLFANQRGGFVLAAPLPPLGRFLSSGQLPFSLSPEGVLACVATNVNPGWRPARSELFFRFEEIHDITARGRKLMLNGKFFITAASAALARHFASDLQKFAKLDATKRAAVIAEWINATLDRETVRRRWQELKKLSRPVRLLANVLFVYLFAFAPVLIWCVGFKLSWIGLLAGLLTLTSATAVFFYRAHRTLFPKAEDDRFTHTLTVMLAPMATMRAHDVLSRQLFEAYHPLVMANVLLPPNDFHGFARHVLLDLRHPAEPVCPGNNPMARTTELYTRTTLRAAVENSLKQWMLSLDELCKPPRLMDESCRAYCPRCGAQFTTVDVTCGDCGGLALTAFDSRSKAAVTAVKQE